MRERRRFWQRFFDGPIAEHLLANRELFTDRREQADEAADVVRRIRADEVVHVAYLRTLFGELRHAAIRSVDGSKKPGAEIIDPAWERQVRLSTVTNARLQRDDMRRVLRQRILEAPGGERLLEEFESLNDPGAFD